MSKFQSVVYFVQQVWPAYLAMFIGCTLGLSIVHVLNNPPESVPQISCTIK